MPTCTTDRARIAGVVSAVPDCYADGAQYAAEFGEAAVAGIVNSTGVKQRPVAPAGICSSDLCAAAANALLSELEWSRDSVDALIFVSQTPDYILPATACVLQGELGLASTCAAFDVNLGCSGYVYGLWLACQLVQGGGARRVLLLVGDTVTMRCSSQDRAVALLFGDAGSATAIEYTSESVRISFDLGSDGSRYRALMVPAGGCRLPSSEETRRRTERGTNNIRSDEEIVMDGGEIFTFTLRVVPAQVKSVIDLAGWSADQVDGFVFHQANGFMLQHLAKRMKVPAGRMPLSLDSYGNTSSASIPVTLSHSLGHRLRKERLRLVLSGFGVGLSMASAALECGPIVAPDVIKVDTHSLRTGSGAPR